MIQSTLRRAASRLGLGGGVVEYDDSQPVKSGRICSGERQLTLIILYEDNERTLKLLEQMSSHPSMSSLRVELLDAGVDCGIVRARQDHGDPDTPAATKKPSRLLLSRCSGSFASRGHTRSPSVIEDVIFVAERSPDCRVFNGCAAFRLEMNKALANFHIESTDFRCRCREASGSREDHLRVPPGVVVTSLGEKVIERAVQSLGAGPDYFVKGIVGGGSTSVARLQTTRTTHPTDLRVFLRAQLRSVARDMEEVGAHRDVFLLQQRTPSARAGVQYRFELVAGRFHYAVRVVQRARQDIPGSPHHHDNNTDHRVDNLCMCDIDADDPSTELTILTSAEELAAEPGVDSRRAALGIISCLETFASDFDLMIVAIEGTLSDGALHAFDINTNSNYNAALERRHGVRPGAWAILDAMLASR
jgi:hypothetical protein